MARYTESVCRICRREGFKLFLKGDRCFTDKCAIDRRGYPPGQHGMGRRPKVSNYGTHLREKQKIRKMYGLLERQFRNYFYQAAKDKGNTGVNLLLLLEQRLDNVVYRLGMASSRSEARQYVRHGHFKVNGRRLDLPSYQVKLSDNITVREKSQKIAQLNLALDAVERKGVPAWLELKRETFEGTVRTLPTREELTMPMQEQLVVEFYSK